MKSKICEGIPELDIPSLDDPLVLDTLVISDVPNTKLYMRDMKVSGLCDFTINSFQTDFEKLHYNAKILFGRITMNGTYDFDVRVLVPIVYKGNIYITADNIEAEVNLNLKKITKNDKTYVYLSKIKFNLNIKGYNAKYDLNEEENGQLAEVISNFIGSNQEEVVESFKPALEEAISRQVLLISKDIVKHFTYDELFPDRT